MSFDCFIPCDEPATHTATHCKDTLQHTAPDNYHMYIFFFYIYDNYLVQ